MSIHGSARHWEDEACEILRASTSHEDIHFVCSYFPFQYPGTPLGILSNRRTESSLTNIDEFVLRKAEEILRRTATECDSCSWDWQWSPPFASTTMGPTRAANDTDKDLLAFASKVSFMALQRKACGLQSRAVEDMCEGMNEARLSLQNRFNELDISRKEYEEVEKELENPFARWIFSTSLRSTSSLPSAYDALAPILRPIKEVFENRKLSLISMLRRLKVLHLRHQDILDGLDPKWDGLSEEDFYFLEDVWDHTPRELASLFIEEDLSCSQKFDPNDFVCPTELRRKSPQWSRLIHTVRVYAKAHPDLVWRIDEAAKILLSHKDFFSGMALVYGLCEANHPPTEVWWNLLTVRNICRAYQVRCWLRRPPERIEDEAGSKLTGAETKRGRSCMGLLLETTSTLFATPLSVQQSMTSLPHTSDKLSEHKEELSKEQVDSTARGFWSDRSTMVGSELGTEMDQGRSGIENVGSVASNFVSFGLGSPSQPLSDPSHTNDHGHTEIAMGSETDHDSDLDSALGLDRRDSTTTLSSEAFKPVEKHGRTYHGYHEGRYLLPNDEQEQERLDLQHHLFDLTLNGSLHLVQHPTIRRALDIGTGTGIWSVDFADKHHDVHVYGVDLSPIQPDWTPPNCTFQVDDLSHSWNFEFPFDFIHGRMLFCSFPDPIHVFKEAFKALTPGGVIEMQDLIFDFQSPDGSLEGSSLETWAKKLTEAFRSTGIDLTSASRYPNHLATVGFENIQQERFLWPVGTWPKDKNLKVLGRWCKENILEMLFAISIVPLTEHRQHSMSVEAVQLLLVSVREDLRNPKILAYLQIIVVHGRKPEQNVFLELEN